MIDENVNNNQNEQEKKNCERIETRGKEMEEFTYI